jgi:hypothetical protein
METIMDDWGRLGTLPASDLSFAAKKQLETS